MQDKLKSLGHKLRLNSTKWQTQRYSWFANSQTEILVVFGKTIATMLWRGPGCCYSIQKALHVWALCSPLSQTCHLRVCPGAWATSRVMFPYLYSKPQQFLTSILAAQCLGWLQPLAALLQLYKSSPWGQQTVNAKTQQYSYKIPHRSSAQLFHFGHLSTSYVLSASQK